LEKKYYKPKYIRNIIIFLLFITIVSLLSYFIIIRQINYNLGERYYITKLYPDAIKKLKPLGDYKSSKSLYIRALYKQGLSYYNSYNYLLALESFKELSIILPETSALINDTNYMMALQEGINEHYDECIIILTTLSGYEKSNQLIKDANNKKHESFVIEHRTHVIIYTFKDIVDFYLNNK